jgi:tRNA(Ile)-lysidine synthase
MDLFTTVSNYIQQERLLKTGAKVVVGVSGGSDSLCLLHVLRQLQPDLRLSLHIAHLNHCLRGPEADEDMIFVALLATKWGIPCTIQVENVADVAKYERRSLEETARHVRYRFLADVAHRVNASTVAVGHNGDDQSETVLMHFVRGTGLSGLRGMLPATNLASLQLDYRAQPVPVSFEHLQLIRPLLSIPRAEIERYCQAHDLTPRFDRSNLDRTYFRNRLRHELIPILETYNPNIRALLRQTASLTAADYALVSAACDEAWTESVAQEQETAIGFDLTIWRNLPLALQRATLRRAIQQLRPQLQDIDFVHIKQAVEIGINGSTGAKVTLPQNTHLVVGYETLRLYIDENVSTLPDWALLWQDEPISIKVPGKTCLSQRKTAMIPATGQCPDTTAHHCKQYLKAHLCEGELDTILSNTDRWTAYLDADQLGPKVSLRQRRPGDRFQPLGMGGKSMEVTDFMINSKIPRHWRDQIPILVHTQSSAANKDEIAWIVGWRIDDRVKITARTRRTIRLHWFHGQA